MEYVRNIVAGGRVVRSASYMNGMAMADDRKRPKWAGTVKECFVYEGQPMCVVTWDREYDGQKTAIPWFTHLARDLELAT